MRDESPVAIVYGPAMMGKTVLVAEVLARRAHKRQPVVLSVQTTTSVWNIIESYLGAIGCKCPMEIAVRFNDMNFADVKAPLAALIDRAAKHSVIVFDHFERLTDPDSQILDEEIRDLLSLLICAPDAKVIITSRNEPKLSFLPASVHVNVGQPVVGRFPKGSHVENVLDDFVDRAQYQLASYPDELLMAIDRHPYVATLAAKIIRAEGPSALTDQGFLQMVRRRLRDELLRRIVTPASMPVVELLSDLRTPTPRQLLEGIAGLDAVREAESLGLVYRVTDRYRSPPPAGVSQHVHHDEAVPRKGLARCANRGAVL